MSSMLLREAAQEPNLAPVDAYKLERVGGQILSLVK